MILQEEMAEILKEIEGQPNIDAPEREMLLCIFKQVQQTLTDPAEAKAQLLEAVSPQSRDALTASLAIAMQEGGRKMDIQRAASGFLLFINGIITERKRWIGAIKSRVAEDRLAKEEPRSKTVH